MKKVKVLIEMGKDGFFSAYMDDTPLDYSCMGIGKTVEESIEDFKRGYNEMRGYYKEKGKHFEEVAFSFYALS